MEFFKNVIRYLLFVPAILTGGEFRAPAGSPRAGFFDWLYGSGKPEFETWFPDGEG